MAGEWLKFECSLPEKPETLAITVAMGWDDPDLTVGKLMRLFRWFDQHTVDGNAYGVTPALLDRLIGVTGFVQAVANAGWIFITDGGLALNHFDRHNGMTAKNRAQTAKRVANHRASSYEAGQCNDPIVTSALAREEKKREEVIQRDAGKPADLPGFAEFWKTWPSNDRKQAKGKCLDAWKKAHAERDAALILAHVESLKLSQSWRKNGGEFVPAPLVYLNNKRWEGAELADATESSVGAFV